MDGGRLTQPFLRSLDLDAAPAVAALVYLLGLLLLLGVRGVLLPALLGEETVWISPGFLLLFGVALDGQVSVLLLLVHNQLGVFLHGRQGDFLAFKDEGRDYPVVEVIIVLALDAQFCNLLVLHEHLAHAAEELDVQTLLADCVQQLLAVALLLLLNVSQLVLCLLVLLLEQFNDLAFGLDLLLETLVLLIGIERLLFNFLAFLEQLLFSLALLLHLDLVFAVSLALLLLLLLQSLAALHHLHFHLLDHRLQTFLFLLFNPQQLLLLLQLVLNPLLVLPDEHLLLLQFLQRLQLLLHCRLLVLLLGLLLILLLLLLPLFAPLFGLLRL